MRSLMVTAGERILKIGQHLVKLWARVGYHFWFTGYLCNNFV